MVALRNTKLFAGLSAAELAELEKMSKSQPLMAGAIIFKEGDQGDGIYVVLDGKVQISALVGQDQRRVLSTIAPGEFFGEMAVLDNEPRSATATAETDACVLFIPRLDILDMLDRSPRLAVSLVREFSLRMRDFNRQYIREVLQAERLTLVGRFARSIVHDFKNPLNVIGISAEMAAMDSATGPMRVNAKVRIRKQVDRMSNMINELLEFTRGSQAPIILAENDYSHYIQSLVEEIRPEIEVKNVTIHFDNQPPAMTILMDPSRLTHVFFNLIHNAVDAMSEGGGGQVILRFEVRPTEVLTEIEDTGKGIAPEIAARLFEAFATYGKAQGTGLGLSICKKIIEDHRGRISAHNSPRGGAVFSFTLPLKK